MNAAWKGAPSIVPFTDLVEPKNATDSSQVMSAVSLFS